MTKQDIQQFLESRPSLSKVGFCREAGISRQLIDYILNDDRNLTDDTIEKIKPVMLRYGWSKNK
jgi:plasmid maintenance system antidote protein VapI